MRTANGGQRAQASPPASPVEPSLVRTPRPLLFPRLSPEALDPAVEGNPRVGSFEGLGAPVPSCSVVEALASHLPLS